jgi:hypothetical protein
MWQVFNESYPQVISARQTSAFKQRCQIAVPCQQAETNFHIALPAYGHSMMILVC